MGNSDEAQSYGLGVIEGAHFKGGWGPDDETGSYTVRQFRSFQWAMLKPKRWRFSSMLTHVTTKNRSAYAQCLG